MVITIKSRLFKAELIGFVFCCVLGTLSHFFYEWSGENTFIGLLCPVNESVWEHLKLIYTPYIIWSAAEFFILKGSKLNLFLSKFCSVICGMLTILFIHYTYTGAVGTESTTADIISFFAGVAAAFILSYTIMKNSKYKGAVCETVSFILLIITGGIFILFTFSPPLIPLFEDSITKTYGI